MEYCPHCSANLDQVEAGEPCPTCGSTDRAANAYAQPTVAKVTVPEVSLQMTKDPDRPWYEKWWETVAALDSLREAYSTRLGNVEAERRVKEFFKVCNEVADWLKHDNVFAPHVTEAAVNAFFFADPDLSIANAMANTE